MNFIQWVHFIWIKLKHFHNRNNFISGEQFAGNLIVSNWGLVLSLSTSQGILGHCICILECTVYTISNVCNRRTTVPAAKTFVLLSIDFNKIRLKSNPKKVWPSNFSFAWKKKSVFICAKIMQCQSLQTTGQSDPCRNGGISSKHLSVRPSPGGLGPWWPRP